MWDNLQPENKNKNMKMMMYKYDASDINSDREIFIINKTSKPIFD